MTDHTFLQPPVITSNSLGANLEYGEYIVKLRRRWWLELSVLLIIH